jgi:acetyl esterase/lipase
MNSTYPVEIVNTTMAGVTIEIVTPKHAAPRERDRMLVCLHGGGFTSDSGSVFESTSIAALTGTRVITVEYRPAPQFPFPAAVDDTVAVYKQVLKDHAADKIAVYGTSAGAVLSA